MFLYVHVMLRFMHYPTKNIFAHQLRFFFVLPDQCKYRGKEQQVVKRSAWSAISSLWLVSVDLVVSWFKLSDRWVGWLQNVLIKDHGVIKFGQCLTCNITYYQGYWEVSWARCCLLEICFSTWFQALVASCHRGLPMFCPLWLQLVSMRNFSSCSWVQNGVLSGVFRLLYSVAWPYWSPISSKPLVKSMPLHPKSRNKNNLWMRSGSRPSVWSWMLWLMKMKKHQGYLEEWWVFLLKPGTKNPLFLGQKKDARKKKADVAQDVGSLGIDIFGQLVGGDTTMTWSRRINWTGLVWSICHMIFTRRIDVSSAPACCVRVGASGWPRSHQSKSLPRCVALSIDKYRRLCYVCLLQGHSTPFRWAKGSIVKNPRVKRFLEKSMEKQYAGDGSRFARKKGGLESLLGVQVGRRLSYVRCQCCKFYAKSGMSFEWISLNFFGVFLIENTFRFADSGWIHEWKRNGFKEKHIIFVLVWSMIFISNSLRTSFKWVTCKLYSTLKTKVVAIDVEISEMKQQCSFCLFLGNFKPTEACKPSLNHLNHLKHHHNQPTLPDLFTPGVSPVHLCRCGWVVTVCGDDSLQKGSMGNALLLVGWHQSTFDGQLCHLGQIWVSRWADDDELMSWKTNYISKNTS